MVVEINCRESFTAFAALHSCSRIDDPLVALQEGQLANRDFDVQLREAVVASGGNVTASMARHLQSFLGGSKRLTANQLIGEVVVAATLE